MSIKIGNAEPAIIPTNQKINFIDGDENIALTTTPLKRNQASIGLLYFEENKELWSITPYCLDFWLITSGRFILENTVLIKIGKRSVIKASLLN